MCSNKINKLISVAHKNKIGKYWPAECVNYTHRHLIHPTDPSVYFSVCALCMCMKPQCNFIKGLTHTPSHSHSHTDFGSDACCGCLYNQQMKNIVHRLPSCARSHTSKHARTLLSTTPCVSPSTNEVHLVVIQVQRTLTPLPSSLPAWLSLTAWQY